MQRSLTRRIGAIATITVGAASSVLISSAPAGAAPAVTVGPGSEIDVVQRETREGIEVSACTMGVLALAPDGRRVGVTAGHCGRPGQQVAVPVPGRDRTIAAIGTIEKSSNPKVAPNGRVDDPNQPDWATVSFRPGVPLANRKGNVAPRSVGRAAVGDRVCRQGRTTGWQCGKVVDVAAHRVLADLKGDHGDSGGPLVRLSDGAVVALTTGGLQFADNGPLRSQFIDLGYVLRAAGGLRLAV